MGFTLNPIAFLKGINFFSYFNNLSRKLMTNYNRYLHLFFCPCVIIINMNICSTNGTGFNLHKNVSVADCWFRNIYKVSTSFRSSLHYSFQNSYPPSLWLGKFTLKSLLIKIMIKPLHECIVAAFLRKSYFCLVLPKDKLLAVSTTDGCMVLNVEDMNKVNYCLQGESVNNVLMSRSGKLFASTLTNGVFMSVDGKKWEQKSKGLHVKKVWTIEEDRHTKGVLYAGTQYGHLFKSGDEGESWEEVTGLFNAPNRKNWGIDWGYGTTGLTIHTIKSDPFIKDRLFIVASGNGVYRSDDSGESWKDVSPDKQTRHGFAIATAKNDMVFVIPAYQGICKDHLSCIKGMLRVLYSEDYGKTWKESKSGLPNDVHTCVLRDCLSVDRNDPANIFFGTTTGEVYYSSDEGESWQRIMKDAGRIQGIAALAA